MAEYEGKHKEANEHKPLKWITIKWLNGQAPCDGLPGFVETHGNRATIHDVILKLKGHKLERLAYKWLYCTWLAGPKDCRIYVHCEDCCIAHGTKDTFRHTGTKLRLNKFRRFLLKKAREVCR